MLTILTIYIYINEIYIINNNLNIFFKKLNTSNNIYIDIDIDIKCNQEYHNSITQIVNV